MTSRCTSVDHQRLKGDYCQNESLSDKATYLLSDPQDVSKYDQEAVQERCRSGIGGFDERGCSVVNVHEFREELPIRIFWLCVHVVQNPFNDRSKDTGLSSAGVESRAVLPNFTGIVSIGYITEQTIRGYSRYHVTRSGARGGGWVQILLYHVIIEEGAYLSHRYIGVMHFSCESIFIFDSLLAKLCINREVSESSKSTQHAVDLQQTRTL